MSAPPSTVERVDAAADTAPPRRQPAWAVAVLLIGGIVYVMLFVGAIGRADSELLQGLTVAPVLFALTIPFALRIARNDRDRTLSTIVLAGITAKLIMAYVQFQIAYGYYNGRVDAQQYHEVGEALAPAYRRFDFTTNIGELVGTGYVKVITGVVYAIAGTSRVTGFLVFGWLGFLGLLLIARAFRIGIPSGDSRRYLIVVLFMPSLLYWPATIGKEAIMILGIGLCAYAVASIFHGNLTGLLAGAAGLFLILLIRPHVALLVFAGVAFAAIVRRAPARTYAAPLFRFLGAALLVVLALFLMSKTSAFLDKNLKSTSITEQLDETQANTTEAGSAFTPATVNSPFDLPWATVTVLFRPFPQEASNFAGLLSAGEGLLLIALFATSLSRIRSVPRMIRTTPYLAFSLAYVFAFIIAFSRFANFGILARQRVQMIPFVLVLIALPKFRDLVGTGDTTTTDATAAAPVTPVAAVGAGGTVTRIVGTTGTRRRLRPVRERNPVSSGAAFAPPPRSTG